MEILARPSYDGCFLRAVFQGIPSIYCFTFKNHDQVGCVQGGWFRSQ